MSDLNFGVVRKLLNPDGMLAAIVDRGLRGDQDRGLVLVLHPELQLPSDNFSNKQKKINKCFRGAK